jgi:hypothetical protein
VLVVLVLALATPFLSAQAGEGGPPASLLSFHFAPSLDVPLFGSARNYTPTGRAELGMALRMPFLRALSLGLDVGYVFLPIRNAQTFGESLSVVSGLAGMGIHVALAPRLELAARGRAGYGYGLMN